MEKLIKSLERHEGRKNKLYMDSEGNISGGIGHYFKVGSYLPDEVIDILFKVDIATAISEFNKIDINLRKKLNINRKRVITEMIFNMGPRGVMGFKQMWVCIAKDDFDGAADNMLWNFHPDGSRTPTPWSTEVGDGPGRRFDRADELAEIMRKGE